MNAPALHVRLAGTILLAIPLLSQLPASAAKPDTPTANARPDPASVQSYGPAYRYPRAGWIVLHVEGAPYDRGYQHGRLLAPEIADYIKTLAGKRSVRDPSAAWNAVRTTTNALFLRKYDPEFLEEMKGIADGATAAGAMFEGRPLDMLDLVSVNSDIELEFLDSALDATTTGLEGKTFGTPPEIAPAPAPPEHCSAFVANGPATADGKIVIGHITMFSLPFVRHFNVWIDVKPAKGHRVLMQTYPGGIQSGMDYYMNDVGLVVAETTIRQTKFDGDSVPLASRIRKALQYCDSIDGVVSILKSGNNGLYTNEWLIADTKTNEIAMFELGTKKSKLWRSSKDEWIGGTKGFYWGCNNAKDLDVRLETVAALDGKPANVVYHPSDRDRAWLLLYDKHKGRISEQFGFEAFTTPPLSAFASLDAKFTTTEMAKDLKTWAVFGPPLGKTWDPSEADRKRWPDVQPLVSNDWTVLTTDAPAAVKTPDVAAEASGDQQIAGLKAARDAHPKEVERQNKPVKGLRSAVGTEGVEGFNVRKVNFDAKESAGQSSGQTPPRRSAIDLVVSSSEAADDNGRSPHLILSDAWHGTLLPKADADTWLAAAFADYEPIVARELALKALAKAKSRELTRSEKDETAVALFGPTSRYKTAVARLGQDIPLSQIKSSLIDDDWYQIASGKGVLLLAALRETLGTDSFLKLMDAFGRSHAGKPVTSQEFVAAVAASPGFKPAWFDAWLTGTGLPTGPGGGMWSIDSFENDLDRTVIVVGTVKESDAQREAGLRLQRQIQRKWSNITVPILTDLEATPEALKGRHVLLVGRPETNSVAARMSESLPVAFGPASFVVRGETYGHAKSAVIAAGPRPDDPKSEVVIFAGLSAEATWRCVEAVGTRDAQPAEVLVLPANGRASRLVVGTKPDTNGGAVNR